MEAGVQHDVSGGYMHNIFEPVMHQRPEKATTQIYQVRLTTASMLVELMYLQYKRRYQ